ncbi:hypothetical protein WICPIJ_001037 [Wickerhamomyces pijperi]|uniref:Phosphoacetylglucosamine mutase n=1 Tax=Wickerhamomyces pijperi TaxID=599730 RepID=A0A9P8QEC4_WICPI|nr:hypothetical protein WICPIJ_001037 [Wickerhamomyces pijperi]
MPHTNTIEISSDQPTTTTAMSFRDQLHALYAPHQKPGHLSFTYGTAGFRTLASTLDSVVFTVGILASLRSKYLNGQTIGIMITASHNPPQDNGIKLIDPQGEMLEASWEAYATKLANLGTEEEVFAEVERLAQNLGIDLNDGVSGNVIIARDSRESGLALTKATIDGLKTMGTKVTDYQLLTTPELHYLVKCINTQGAYGEVSEVGYYKKLSTAFRNIYENFVQSDSKIQITIDAANGIGGPKAETLFTEYLSQYVDFQLVNNQYQDPQALNVGSGADFVKTNQKLPNNITPEPLKLYASFDGDADRVVFYYVDSNSVFKLLDGDKIATLLAGFFKDLVSKSPAKLSESCQIGVVQTAYANGSSTNHITDVLQVPVVCTPTGVKHLHHEAAKFDIGVYFEANGHGTVLFSESLLSLLQTIEPSTPQEQRSIQTLIEISNLINQTVGDAISDLLTVLIVLSIKQWTPDNWDESYTDLPNRLAKVIVPDRHVFKTINAERQLTSPKGLQLQIDDAVSKYNGGRSFVRASGTEDAVRVYAEAASKSECEELSKEVCELVKSSVGL